MSKLILAVTKSVSPDGKPSSTDRTIVVESDKFVILPDDGDTKSIVLVNGWTFYVDAEVAELGEIMSASDASVYT